MVSCDFKIIYVFIFLLYIRSGLSVWWSLGMSNVYQTILDLKPTTYKTYCKKLNYLVERQRELCALNQNILHVISKGAKLGIEECQYQFQMNRWNCTTHEAEELKVFGGVLDIQSREKAYIYSITAAGLAYSVTRACSKGELTECGCDDRVRNKDTKGKWEWGGCSDDIRYGTDFSKNFVDSIENHTIPEGIMNLHNNEAGRRSIRANMELLCKCHGVSGSCTVRVCWRRMKPFRQIGEHLALKFDGSTHVKVMQANQKTRLRPVLRHIKRPSKRDLVYLQDSLDYCFQNITFGILGTKGRVCNATSYGMDGCRLLCCGRGYQTIEKEVEEKCQCKFVWCCKVQCQKCTTRIHQHYCN